MIDETCLICKEKREHITNEYYRQMVELRQEYQKQLVQMEEAHIQHANSLVYVPEDLALIGDN